MNRARVFQVVGAAIAASALVWAVTMAIGGRQPGPEPAEAIGSGASPKAVIDDAMLEVEDSMNGPMGMSSNPVWIADNSPALDRVVALGTPAITEAVSQIERSPESGLREYLLAICVNRIAKAQVAGRPGQDTYWSTGKQFPAAWRTHLSRIPETVSTIARSGVGSEEKNARLTALGTPAIPFILDEVERGHRDLSPAAQVLMQDTVEMGGASPRGLVTPEWAKGNKARFVRLRDLVLTEAGGH